VASLIEVKNAHKILAGKPEERRSLGRPINRREDNVIMDIREILWEGVEWIHVAQDRDQVGSCESGN